MDLKYQKNSIKATCVSGKKGEAYSDLQQGVIKSVASKSPENLRVERDLMEEIFSRENLKQAYKNVIRNKGSAGIDGMTVDELLPYLQENWERIKLELLEGRYELQPVKEVEIPKPGSKGKRKLGIPTVKDRLISQAILQVLQKEFDSRFSKYSYGFRPGKSAHQAISQSQKYVSEGYKYVVDMDLEKFFNTVNHDKLMSEIAKRIGDKILLKLLRGFLNTGILSKGLVKSSERGMPQGNPLSPLLSNILLDLLDKELANRGHKFCRYADDCNIYLRSKRSGERVLSSIKKFIENKLKLKINESKSKVDVVSKRSFLGFSFCRNVKDHKLKLSKGTIVRFKKRVRELTRLGKGTSMDKVIERLVRYSRGWLSYFQRIDHFYPRIDCAEKNTIGYYIAKY